MENGPEEALAFGNEATFGLDAVDVTLDSKRGISVTVVN